MLGEGLNEVLGGDVANGNTAHLVDDGKFDLKRVRVEDTYIHGGGRAHIY